MSDERIDLTQFEGIGDWEVVPQPDGEYAIVTGRDNSSLEEANTIAKLPTLIAELKRCYEELDWLLVVEDHFTSDGSYNDNANFVYECAVNEKYGYRIEVIDGVETVVHESEC